jgi:hypothetical protein
MDAEQNVVNLRDRKRQKNLKKTADELEQVIKSLELAKKSLLSHVQYSGIKRLLVEIDDSRKLYVGLYKKANFEIRLLSGEKIDE